MGSKTFTRFSTPLTAAAIALLTFAAFHTILFNAFVEWDDDSLITNNPIVTGGLTIPNVVGAFTRYDPQLYLPLTFLSYQLNVAVAGVHPWIFLLTNLVLHIANVLLVWFVVERLLKNRTAAIITAVLFAIHPLQVEAVAWASARKDVLSSFFFLVTFALYLRGRTKLSVATFALGLFSKVSIVVAPGILLLTDWLQEGKISARRLVEKIPYAVLAIAGIVIALFGKAAAGWFPSEKILIACKATIFYLQKLILPFGFSTVYPYTKSIGILTPDLLVSVLLVIGISAAVCYFHRFRILVFAWIWYLLFLLPSFSTVAKGYNQAFDVYFASDRYAYLAIIGPLLLVGLFCEHMMRRHRIAVTTLLGCVVLILSFLTYRQTLVWRDTETLFRHAIAAYPDSHIAHTNLGNVLYHQGDSEGAQREFEAALAIRPDARAYDNLAAIAYESGDNKKAIDLYHKAIDVAPGDIDAYINAGGLLVNAKSFADALPLLQQAVELDPSNRNALVNLALAQEGLGKIADAIATLQKAQKLYPQDEDIRLTLRDLQAK